MKIADSQRDIYVSPNIEIIVFNLEDSIAVSGEQLSGLVCQEEKK